MIVVIHLIFVIILYNISNIDLNTETRQILFPSKLFFVFILIPLIIIFVFGICYKWYTNKKNKKGKKLKRKCKNKSKWW